MNTQVRPRWRTTSRRKQKTASSGKSVFVVGVDVLFLKQSHAELLNLLEVEVVIKAAELPKTFHDSCHPCLRVISVARQIGKISYQSVTTSIDQNPERTQPKLFTQGELWGRVVV